MTLEDAAVKLRRLGALVEKGQPARLLAGALGAVEKMVVRSPKSEFYRSPSSLFMARRTARPAARALSSSRVICLASFTTALATLAAFSLTRGLEASFCAA